MCGIAGIVDLDRSGRPDVRTVRAMADTLAHRGPDGAGTLAEGNVAFGHRRLSIIDLATGGQPMVSASGRTAIVFNGEIYNYRQLRRALPDARFRTGSDTECLLELYEREGPPFLDKLNGMFAFALHDRARGAVHLVRDRFGVKPLFYALDGGRLLFASTARAILPALARPPAVDGEALAEYLRFGYAAAPRSIHAGIRNLPPGHRLEVRDGKVRIERWYTPAVPAAPPAGARLLALLEDAVRLRLVADVPVGAFLSGGVDSAAVCAFMARHAARPLTFTIGFPVAAYDEREASREAARLFGADHTVLPVEVDGLADLRRISPYLDEPLADPSTIPTWHVCRAARSRVTVALSGDGADELFGGYERYLFARLARFARLFPGARALAFAHRALLAASGRFGASFPLRQALRFLRDAGGTPDPFPGTVSYFSAAEVADLLPGREVAPYRDLETPHASMEEYLRAVLDEDFAWYLPNDILVKLDRASMAVSLEARTPFLDYRVVEFARAMPATLRMRGFRLKAFLKRALRGLLPDSILERPKRGFALPLREWTSGAWHLPLADDLLAADSFALELFGRARLERLLADHRAGRRNHAFPLYNLFALNTWKRGQGKQVPSC